MAAPQCTSTIYVDEAGSPHFQRREAGNRARGYVVCAAYIPNHSRDAVLEVLPRDSAGFMKASSRLMSPVKAAQFIERALEFDLDIGLVLLDTGSEANFSSAKRLTENANVRRKIRGNPPISCANLVYSLAVGEAIMGAWRHGSIRRNVELASFRVVLDDASIARHARSLVESAPRTAFAPVDICCVSVTWASEKSEPLLNVSDIFAGVCSRQVTHGDVKFAWEKIERAAASGRIFLQDGMEIQAPSEQTIEGPPNR